MKDDKTVQSQNQIIKEALERGERLSAWWGVQHGILRFSARIYDLRHDHGMTIKMERVTPEEGNPYGEYFIEAA